MKTYFVECAHSLDETIRLLRKTQASPFVLTTPEIGFFERFLKYTLFLTYKSLQQESASLRPDILWLCKIAGTKNIDRALEFTRPTGKKVALTSEEELSASALAAVGKTFEPTAAERKKAEKTLQKKFEVSDAALKEYALEDLLIEKAAVATTF
ncbi:hypothetical protein H0O03_02915 [Candidatus Micrarchaeota archaeon]|nr:hypothetical protein [Candidatus Micrarchaeota archaeon]